MALILSVSPANWDITGLSAVPFTFLTTYEFVSTMDYLRPLFFFAGAMKTKMTCFCLENKIMNPDVTD